MSKNKKYVIAFRRKRKCLTDYKTRLRLLASKKHRVVIRRSSNNIIIQLVQYNKKGDLTKLATSAKELKKFGWLAHTGNIPSAYLTGFMVGLKAKNKKIKDAVLDIGLTKSKKGLCVYAALKGMIDTGLNIPHSPDIFPSEERLKGEHISKYASFLANENIKIYERQFASYLKNKLKPEELPQHFSNIKDKIVKEIK